MNRPGAAETLLSPWQRRDAGGADRVLQDAAFGFRAADPVCWSVSVGTAQNMFQASKGPMAPYVFSIWMGQ